MLKSITVGYSMPPGNGDDRPNFVIANSKEMTEEKARHFAELFAAAPELLHACQKILEWADRECMPQGSPGDGPWELVESAINKATGN